MFFPKPNRNLWQLLGPSVLLVAVAINGGELLLWPNIVARSGFAVIWAVPVILLLQAAVNLEIERYVVVTGEDTLQGLLKLHRWLSPIFIISILVSLTWPAWASSAGAMTGYLLGVPDLNNGIAIVILGILSLLWQSPRAYELLESIAKIGLITVLGIVVFTLATRWESNLLEEVSKGFLNFGNFPTQLDRFSILSALAFGGVVGVLNLAQSGWVLKKGYGAAGVANPNQISWQDPTSRRNFKAWWRLLQKEHLVVYYLGNVIGIGLLSALAYVTLKDASVSGFTILTSQVEELGGTLGFLFGLAVILIFTMAQLTILDAAGALLEQCLQSLGPKRVFSKARICQALAGVGAVILGLGSVVESFTQPVFLLQLSASLSAGVMVIYPLFLLRLNQKLPSDTQPGIVNKILVFGCVLFYAGVIAWSFG